jgi:hypothetical protein
MFEIALWLIFRDERFCLLWAKNHPYWLLVGAWCAGVALSIAFWVIYARENPDTPFGPRVYFCLKYGLELFLGATVYPMLFYQAFRKYRFKGARTADRSDLVAYLKARRFPNQAPRYPRENYYRLFLPSFRAV